MPLIGISVSAVASSKISSHAEVAKLVDAQRSERCGGNFMRVQVPPSAQNSDNLQLILL